MEEHKKFDNLRYAVHKIGDKPIDKAFPELFRYDEFKALRLLKNIDWRLLTKYIVFLYDKDSDLVSEFSSQLQARKDAAAVEAGFQRDAKGHWPKELQDVMDIREELSYRAIFRYLKIQKYDVWREIVVTEQELEEFQMLRFQSIRKKKNNKAEVDEIEASTKKTKLKEACDIRIKSLESLRAQFYADHQDVKTAEFDEMITPENSARILEADEEEEQVPEASNV